MRAVGVNGWSDGTHDPGVAVIENGKITCVLEEERLLRLRHAVSQLPHGAASYACGGMGKGPGCDAGAVDVLAFGWDLPRYTAARGRRWRISDREFVRRVTGRSDLQNTALEWISHHEAHAASAFYGSGFDSATVLVIDGAGEDASVSIFAGKNMRLELVRSWPMARSLGLFFEAATEQCGFGFMEGGKTMGLAAYEKRRGDTMGLFWSGDDIISPIHDSCREAGVMAGWRRILRRKYGARAGMGASGQSHQAVVHSGSLDDEAEAALRHRPEIAAGAQRTIEEIVRGLVKWGQRETGYSMVCLSGGVALNCVANGKCVSECEELYVQPMAGDCGVAMGAAMVASVRNGTKPLPLDGVDLGPGYSSEDIGAILETCKLKAIRSTDPAREAAERLLRGQVIGWVQGRMEAGPRALGHRSILALPYPEENRRRVNIIKMREIWRPLAPSIRSEEIPAYFGLRFDARYMTISADMTEAGRIIAPAVCHVDGTARPQAVDENSGDFRRLLDHLYEFTGKGVVLNTSFNRRGEPIVCTPADAIRTFMTTALDALILEDWILRKED